MANIDNELLNICISSQGESVRSAIANALTKINEDIQCPHKKLMIKDEDNHRTIEGGPWDEVGVDISGGPVGACFDLDHFGTVTENGYYNLWNTGWTPGHGWNGVTVNVPLHDAKLTTKRITENGVYDPLLEGYDGYSTIEVRIPEAASHDDRLFVTFYDAVGNTIERVKVEYGEAAHCSITPVGDTPFVGWNPDPSHVTYEMDCYPVFLSNLGGTITDDWITISHNCANGNRKYHIGDTKEIAGIGAQSKIEMVLIDIGDVLLTPYQYHRPGSAYTTLWISKYAVADTEIDTSALRQMGSSTILTREGSYYTLDGLVEGECRDPGGSDAPFPTSDVEDGYLIMGESWTRQVHDGSSQPYNQDFTLSVDWRDSASVTDYLRLRGTLKQLGIDHNQDYLTGDYYNVMTTTLDTSRTSWTPSNRVYSEDHERTGLYWDTYNEAYHAYFSADMVEQEVVQSIVQGSRQAQKYAQYMSSVIDVTAGSVGYSVDGRKRLFLVV